MPGLLLVVALGVPLPLGLLADGEWWEEKLLGRHVVASEVYDGFRRLDLSEQVLLAKPAKPELVAKFREGDPEKVKEALNQVEPVKLRGRSLRGALFFQALLPGADLREAQLQGANLGAALLQGAALEAAQLQSPDSQLATDLQLAQLQGANLRQAQLQGAFLEATELQGIFTEPSSRAQFCLEPSFRARIWVEPTCRARTWGEPSCRARICRKPSCRARICDLQNYMGHLLRKCEPRSWICARRAGHRLSKNDWRK